MHLLGEKEKTPQKFEEKKKSGIASRQWGSHRKRKGRKKERKKRRKKERIERKQNKKEKEMATKALAYI